MRYIDKEEGKCFNDTMKNEFYFRKKSAVINLSVAYYKSEEELLSSPGFKVFLKRFFEHLADKEIGLFERTMSGQDVDVYIDHLLKTMKLLMVLDIDDVPGLDHCEQARLLKLVEKAYDFWRKMERYTILISKSENSLQHRKFMEYDAEFNDLVLALYRRLEEKLMGKVNLVYRQMNAGSNGSLVLGRYNSKLPSVYVGLRGIPFVQTMMLHTPVMLYPGTNKREGMFEETPSNPVSYFRYRENTWICYPAKVGNLLVFVYFHQDFISQGLSLANLFEMADREECETRKPDAVILYGAENGRKETVFYHDVPNDLWVGSLSYDPKLEYFGYLKKIMLTCHNLKKIQKGWLPIHGSMFEIKFKDGTRKGVVLIGDSGAGKSETLEAVKTLAGGEIRRVDVVFDDMGTFHEEDGKVYGQGTETGAFIRLDDLDRQTAYRDMERSIFMNPTSALNARVILPCTTYETITHNQTIDYVLYANNYTDQYGIRRFTSMKEAKPVFIEGKRRAKGTTSETGLTATYFANPFGPMQKQEICDPIFDRIFEKLFDTNVYVGEVYTRLGLPDGREGIHEAAEELVRSLRGDAYEKEI